jgi:hypothetical protein
MGWLELKQNAEQNNQENTIKARIKERCANAGVSHIKRVLTENVH